MRKNAHHIYRYYISTDQYMQLESHCHKPVGKVCKRRYMYLFVYWSVTCVSVGAIQAGKLNVVFSGISPVYTVINEVQG